MVFGSALGTIMVANVLVVIIPGQRELVRAKEQGRDPDPAPGLRGKQRSVHNTYFTLPVVFVMISNHYAMTYGGPHNWVVLIAMSVAGASIRAWFVARHKPSSQRRRTDVLPAVLGIVILAVLIVTLSPARPVPTGTAAAGVDGPHVQAIVALRCLPCHATHPSQAGFNAAPNGLVFERMDQLRAHLLQVQEQLSARTMPLGNLTGMTDDERATVLAWIDRGGPP